jgi:hypothetical protein
LYGDHRSRFPHPVVDVERFFAPRSKFGVGIKRRQLLFVAVVVDVVRSVVAVVVISAMAVVDVVDSITVGSTTRAKPTADPRMSTEAIHTGLSTAATLLRPEPLRVLEASSSGACSTEALRLSAARRARSSRPRLIARPPG